MDRAGSPDQDNEMVVVAKPTRGGPFGEWRCAPTDRIDRFTSWEKVFDVVNDPSLSRFIKREYGPDRSKGFEGSIRPLDLDTVKDSSTG